MPASPRVYEGRRHTGGPGRTADTREPGQAVVEFMMNALRLKGEFSPLLFIGRTGLPYSLLRPTIKEAVARGLLDCTADVIEPTALGYRYLNELIYLFYRDETYFT